MCEAVAEQTQAAYQAHQMVSGVNVRAGARKQPGIAWLRSKGPHVGNTKSADTSHTHGVKYRRVMMSALGQTTKTQKFTGNESPQKQNTTAGNGVRRGKLRVSCLVGNWLALIYPKTNKKGTQGKTTISLCYQVLTNTAVNTGSRLVGLGCRFLRCGTRGFRIDLFRPLLGYCASTRLAVGCRVVEMHRRRRDRRSVWFRCTIRKAGTLRLFLP